MPIDDTPTSPVEGPASSDGDKPGLPFGIEVGLSEGSAQQETPEPVQLVSGEPLTGEEAEAIFNLVHELVTKGKAEGDVGKLAVFAGVHKFPARVKCAILSWHALMAALKGQGQPVSTENEQN